MNTIELPKLIVTKQGDLERASLLVSLNDVEIAEVWWNYGAGKSFWCVRHGSRSEEHKSQSSLGALRKFISDVNLPAYWDNDLGARI